MSSSTEDNLSNNHTPNIDSDEEFMQVVFDGRNLLKNKKEYQTEDWAWTSELDDGGIFIFSYLLYDYKQQVLSLSRLKESVYMLSLLRHKMLPRKEKSDLMLLEKFQVIFTLYERLKLEDMSWDACEKYIREQITVQLKTN